MVQRDKNVQVYTKMNADHPISKKKGLSIEMNHEEQRIWLIEQLLAEEPEYANYKIPKEEKGQKDLLRALMNVRMPKPISDEFLKVQDEYLQEENRRIGIVEIDSFAPSRIDNRIFLWQGDMAKLRVDAAVLPANSALLGCFRALHNCLDNSLLNYFTQGSGTRMAAL